MKVTKKKIQQAILDRMAQLESEAKQKHQEKLERHLKDAKERLADHRKREAERKATVRKAEQNLAAFRVKKWSPRPVDMPEAYDRLLQLQRKVKFCEGEEMNVTDSELSLL